MYDLKEGLKRMNQSIDPDMLLFMQQHLEDVVELFSGDQQQLIIDIKLVQIRIY